jgi:amino-acid N-acetyltransferase
VSPEAIAVRPATVDDLDAVRELLQGAGLPTTDLDRSAMSWFLVAAQEEKVIGAIACEPAGSPHGLLRSLVVAPEFQGRGLGERLVAEIEAAARRQGLRGLYLLTTTAAQFFIRLGYAPVDRQAVPPEVRATPEFTSLCPSEATCMQKFLDGVRQNVQKI